MDPDALWMPRPPCSPGERSAGRLVARAFAEAGLPARSETFLAPTSPSWAPLVRALLRLAGAVLVASATPGPAATVLAAAALLGHNRRVAALLGRVPGLGGGSVNVVAHVPGATVSGEPPLVEVSGEPPLEEVSGEPPLVVVAHLDTHPTHGAPLHGAHEAVSRIATWALLIVTVAGRDATGWWRTAAVTLALESVVTIGRICVQEMSLAAQTGRDDNGSGLMSLVRTARLIAGRRLARDVWLVATGASTSGGHGVRAFLAAHPEVARVAWLVELDALGAGELVISPVRRRVPQTRTPPALVRALAGAAIDTGDPIDVRRMPRKHSDAQEALLAGTPAVTLTGGVPPAEEPSTPDVANAQRGAKLVEHLAHSTS